MRSIEREESASLLVPHLIAIAYTFRSLTKYAGFLDAHPSNIGTSKRSMPSVPSTPTCTTPTSNHSAPSYKEKAGGAFPTPRTEGEILSNSNLNPFSFNDLRNATRNFRPDSLIGEGGFGYVYKGWINEQNFAPSKPGSGMVVAIKKLKPEGFQGHKEWLVGQLLTGRRALEKTNVGTEQSLVDWAKPSLGDKRKLYRIMDPRLEGRYLKKGAHELGILALQCISKDAKRRPRMSEVLASLEKLQDSKFGALPPQATRSKTSSTIRRSPMRSPLPRSPLRSPLLRPKPGGSPLPSYMRSPRGIPNGRSLVKLGDDDKRKGK
ncbi:hypothetical protein BHE74_00033428 [Ensete ventricosum]|nr:hypothetical protein BHE74_00033428 [Ensete ventricosum]